MMRTTNRWHFVGMVVALTQSTFLIGNQLIQEMELSSIFLLVLAHLEKCALNTVSGILKTCFLIGSVHPIVVSLFC